MPPLPHELDWGIGGHLSAIGALAYLMNKLAAGRALSEGDRHLLNMLRHYLKAWEAAVADNIPRPSMFPRGIIVLLDALGEGKNLSSTDLALADTLLTLSRQWCRHLKLQTHPEKTQ